MRCCNTCLCGVGMAGRGMTTHGCVCGVDGNGMVMQEVSDGFVWDGVACEGMAIILRCRVEGLLGRDARERG